MEMTKVEKLTRELGKAIQEDVRYKAYYAAKEENDKDAELQAKIGEFNVIRMNLDNELQKEEKDNDAVKELNTKLREVYTEVMNTESMKKFNMAKQGMDMMMNEVNTIISMCTDGADPDTCEVTNCTGSCSTCGGCH